MRVKNLVFKTIFITFGVVLILAIAIFGIVSLVTPSTMMNFTASLGLTEVSGDYAFQEYERSGSISCLARAFIIAAEEKEDDTASERFDYLYQEEGFDAFCKEQDAAIKVQNADGEIESYAEGTYRAYVCGLAACVKYRLAKNNDEGRAEAIRFAIKETGKEFPNGNPAIALAVEAGHARDAAFCTDLLAALEAGGFDETADFSAVKEMLRSMQ